MMDDEARMVPGAENGARLCSGQPSLSITGSALPMMARPMPADAALRVAEQIVSVLASASFHKPPYPPVQPQDIIVVPGQTPEGGWPLVKLTNFGLTGLKARTESSPPGETSPPRVAGELERNEVEVNGQISSAEQSAIAGPRGEYKTTGLRSEIYSLGATMYFLLTGIEL